MLDFLQTDPVAFTLPIGANGFPIYWYGIIVTLGIAIGAWWAGREIERRGENPDHLYNGLLIVVVVGYIFARLWYVFQEMLAGRGAQYDSFVDIINIRAGGANILGGFIGAVLAATWYLRRNKLNFWLYADVAAPAVLIAQAIGRWGNFFNQELYGPPTNLAWGILIDIPNRIAPYTDIELYPAGTRFHPTFLYESLLLLIGFIVLLVLNKRKKDSWKPGTLFAIFLIWWGVERVFIEFFRPDQPTFGESIITYSMALSTIFALAGVYLLLLLYDKLPESAKIRRRRRRTLKPKRKQADTPTQ